MADKITFAQFKRAVTDKSGSSSKEVSAFLDAFIEQILVALKTDKVVRIAGLGSFKLQAVAERKSVNVATGEAIVIPGYNKLTFTPESSIKELIENAGTVTLGESKETPITPLQKLGAQATEIVDILADLGQAPKEVPQTEEPQVEEPQPEEEQPQEEPQVEELPPMVVEVPKEEESEVEEPKEEELEVEEPKEEEQKAEDSKKEESKAEEPKKKYHFWRDFLITTACLLLLIIGGWFFFRAQLTQWMEELHQKLQAPPTQEVVEPKEIEVEEPIIVVDSIPQDSTIEDSIPMDSTIDLDISEEPQEVTTPTQRVVTKKQHIPRDIPEEYNTLGFTNILAIEEMHEDSRLTWMAYRYYGNKKLWVYIYEANKDHISNPNKITVGTPIRIPELTESLKDLNRPETQQLIQQLEQEFRRK